MHWMSEVYFFLFFFFFFPFYRTAPKLGFYVCRSTTLPTALGFIEGWVHSGYDRGFASTVGHTQLSC
jgi:hypothetical protein